MRDTDRKDVSKMNNKPTFVRFTDEWGSMYVNVNEIVAMWPGTDMGTTSLQTTNSNETYTINGSLDNNIAKIRDLINIKE